MVNKGVGWSLNTPIIKKKSGLDQFATKMTYCQCLTFHVLMSNSFMPMFNVSVYIVVGKYQIVPAKAFGSVELKRRCFLNRA